MNNEIIKFSDIIIENISELTNSSEKQMHNVWKKVLKKIKSPTDDINNEKRMPLGEKLASNSRVVDLKNGVLLVEVDHSGWIQYLKMYQKFIIKGLKMEYPTIEINTLAYRQKGSNIKLIDVYKEEMKKSQKEMDIKLKNTEDKLSSLYKNKSNETDINNLPPEMREIFNRLIKQAEEEELNNKI